MLPFGILAIALVGFYVGYIYEYVKLRVAGHRHVESYLNISFEVQARTAE